jgi:hypothetical protein
VKGTFYAVVETPSGFAYHLSTGAGAAAAIRTGDSVTFGTQGAEAVLPVDRHLAEVARSHAGVYAPDPADSRAQAAANRLRAFERVGLAAEESPGRWRVAHDLLEQLQKRHEAEPLRHRLFVKKQPLTLEEQVHYRGPVWLDRVDPKTLTPSGLGAEVARASARRNDVLRGLGIDPNDTSRLAKLSRVERDVVAEQFARRSRQAVVDIPPPGSGDEPRSSSRPGRPPTRSCRMAKASSSSGRRRPNTGMARTSPSRETQRADPLCERP